MLDSSNREEVHLFDNINMCVSVCWLAHFTNPTKHKVGRDKEGEIIMYNNEFALSHPAVRSSVSRERVNWWE